MKRNILSGAFLRALFVAFNQILLVFLCSTPIFCILIDHSRFGVTGALAFVVITVRVIRFFLAIALTYRVRKMISDLDDTMRKRMLMVVLVLTLVCILLEMNKGLSKFYWGISDSLGIYENNMPFFLTVLWEQLFYGDMGWTLLLCFVLLFLPVGRIKDPAE